MGLNAALSIAGTAHDAFSTGIQVSGNNIANSNTPNYIRESLILEASYPRPAGFADSRKRRDRGRH